MTQSNVTADRLSLAAIRDRLREATRLIEAAQQIHAATCDALEYALERPVQTPFENAFESDVPVTAHRRNHRPGRPSKIDADPELGAFIRARIDRMTFPDLAEAVANAFPPDRRIGKSAIHAWWQRTYR